jgi:Uma2 family endonuclease
MATKTLLESPEMVYDVLERQGRWTDEEYLSLTDHMNRLVEFTDGLLELLPWPTDNHQAILQFLLLTFEGFLKPLGGAVRFTTLRLRLRKGKYREPDLLVVLSATDPRRQNRFWTGADLVLEVVSPDDPERDLVVKRRDYAEAGIPEYWIVNPLNETVLVLVLNKKKYRRPTTFRRGDVARSSLLVGFEVSVDEVFDAD